MYESHFAADLGVNTPPIPTTNLLLSHSQERECELCHLAETTESEREHAKSALLAAIFALEQAVAPDHPVRGMVEGSSPSWMGKYIIKREYSEGSHHVFGLKLPQLNPAADDSLLSPLSSSVVDSSWDAAVSSFAHQHHVSNGSGWGSHQSHDTSQQSHSHRSFLSHIMAGIWRIMCLAVCPMSADAASMSASPVPDPEAIAELQPLPSQSADLSPDLQACANSDFGTQQSVIVTANLSNAAAAAADDSRVPVNSDVPAKLDSLLDETADRLLQQSCGQGWLVQPRIANMSGLEYRVYMLGGAAAVSTLKCYQPCIPNISLNLMSPR